MDGDWAQIVNIIDSVGTLGALILIAFAFYSGNLISRKVHDDIVDVYEKEAEKLTKAINGSMVELTKTQRESIEIQERVEQSNLAYRAKIDVAVVSLTKATKSTLRYIKKHDKNTAIIVANAVKEVTDKL